MLFRSSIFFNVLFPVCWLICGLFCDFPFSLFKLKRLLSFRNVFVASFAMPKYELKEMRTFGFHTKKKNTSALRAPQSPFLFWFLHLSLRWKQNSMGKLGNNFTPTSLRCSRPTLSSIQKV